MLRTKKMEKWDDLTLEQLPIETKGRYLEDEKYLV